MSYIIYNDASSAEKGLKILEMSAVSKAKQIRESKMIPGRPEPLVMLKDNLENKECRVVFEASPDVELHSIFSWLSGTGKLILSDEPDKYYNAISCEPVKVVRKNDIYKTVTVVFETGPFAYAVRNDPLVYTEKEFYLTNSGTYYCQPKYKLYGTGDISLIVNGQELILKDVEEYAVADSEKLLCYKNNTIIRSKGYIPFLNTGNNSIQTNSKQIEITKNERWL